jgi:hypothetical protein
MPSTYTLISSNVLSSSAASVTFSAIAADWTDLVLRWSARDNVAGNTQAIVMRLNGLATSIYSATYLYNSAGSVGSFTSGGNSSIDVQYASAGTSSTADTFTSYEIYLPSYTATQNKPFSAIGVSENNSANAYINLQANLFRSTAAITTILLTPNTGSFVSGSSFYLYGIKNS